VSANNGNGRHAARLLDALPAPARQSDWNSYCLYCATWHFGEYRPDCSQCHEPIYQWVRDSELRLFRSSSSLHGF
jgi:hypothetical protein